MKFTVEKLKSVQDRLSKITQDWVKDYAIEIDDYALPPLLEIVRYLTEFGETDGRLSAKSKDEIMRTAILGKTVTVYYKGEKLEGFTMNKRDDLLDAFPTLKAHPTVVMLIQQTAVARMLEKSLPLPVESVRPVAAATPQSPASSSRKPGAV
jgi:hypothetical protein